MRLGLVLLSSACAAVALAQTPAPPMPDLSHYRAWKLVNDKRYFVPDRVAVLCGPSMAARQNPSPHRDKYIAVYVNPAGQKRLLGRELGAYPVGTVIVKEKYGQKTGGKPELSTVMIKREPGYDPTGGDWEYAVVDGSATLMERGRIAKCQSCHAARKSTDFVFRTYRPGAPANPWKEGTLLPPTGS